MNNETKEKLTALFRGYFSRANVVFHDDRLISLYEVDQDCSIRIMISEQARLLVSLTDFNTGKQYRSGLNPIPDDSGIFEIVDRAIPHLNNKLCTLRRMQIDGAIREIQEIYGEIGGEEDVQQEETLAEEEVQDEQA